MGLLRVTVMLKATQKSRKKYQALFLVDTGSTYSMAPAKELRKIGIAPVDRNVYELADGSKREYSFGPAVIEFMGEITAGRIIFGPDDVEPILGVEALESVGIVVDPKKRTLWKLPALPLKRNMH